MKIITNNHVRDILNWWDLTDKEKLEFDWITDNEDNNPDDFQFIKYKDWIYCLSDFLRYPSMWGSLPDEFNGWDSYTSDSFFSGILIKFPDPDNWDYENGIIIGWYYS